MFIYLFIYFACQESAVPLSCTPNSAKGVVVGKTGGGSVRRRGRGAPLGAQREGGVCALQAEGGLVTLRLQVQEMKEQCHGKVRNVPGQLSRCAPETGQPGGCLPGWDTPRVGWLPCLPVSQAGAVIPRLHLWALGCPHPDLAAACRECAREAPPWNQATAEAAWLCWPAGHPSSSFCSFSLGLGTCWPWDCPLISLYLQVPVPHPSGAQCWKAPQRFTSYYNPCAEDGPATHRENMTHHSNSENPRQTGTQNLHLLMPCPEHFLPPTPWLSWSWSPHHHRGSPLPRDLT